ncbi:MAG: DUF502 domain-containing protein [Chloroflexota bacterium]
MKDTRRTFWGRLAKNLRTKFTVGLIAILPLTATILILVWLFNTIDNILQPLITYILGHPITGAGFGLTVILIYLAGVIASNVIGKRLIRYAESVLPFMPVVKQLYGGIKQILESFSTYDKTGLLVVLVEFPRKGMKAIGFITNESYDKSGKKLLSVFIPNVPNPTTGFLQIMGEEEVIRTDISVDDALRILVSAGIVSPKEATDKLAADS